MAIRCRFNPLGNFLEAVNELVVTGDWKPLPILFRQLHRSSYWSWCFTPYKGLKCFNVHCWKQTNQSLTSRKLRCQLVHAQALQPFKFKCQSMALNVFKTAEILKISVLRQFFLLNKQLSPYIQSSLLHNFST